ncbi:MAG: DNA adenine methylase [Elusimicrobia bacterium]|nr:MAG: DNA adenine methylase [Elusimicrobiota bacterium]KAF0152915.1 MAG: DNA adenine methylase [Elusimicrobiota bacterium]
MMRRNILQASLLLKGKTKLYSRNYWDVLRNVKPKDLVYMDPPYQGVCGNRDSRYFAGIDRNKFIEVLCGLNKNNVSYILSYDGRTGEKDFGVKLPAYLSLEHVELCAGRSSQATLLGRDAVTYESLYISPALARITKEPIARILELA